MIDEEREAEAPGPRSFWSGTLTFGLVSIPVELYAANRSVLPTLRMLAPDGAPLRRAYFCPAEERELEPDEVVRGYELEPDSFVVVSDEELDALEPEKSRDILLHRFVPRGSIPKAYFERAYYLAPGGRSTRAYAVLAQTMESSGRAGIATFVMRGREYAVAIVAERGLLQAQTLRFADELRSPEEVGLPSPWHPPERVVRAMVDLIRDATVPDLPEEVWQDERAERLRALARRKLERGEDVVERAEPIEEGAEPLGEIPDLIELLRRRLSAPSDERRRPAARTLREEGGLVAATKKELYERAAELGVRGRSRMSKAELLRAIREAGRE